MNESAPAALVDLLAELRLALPAEVQSVARRAGRLARGLPAFEQVWVDALAQARVLTFYQAAEINAGRGCRLGLGPLVLCEPLADLGYAQMFRARRREGGRALRVCVVRTETGQAAAWDDWLAHLVRKQVRANHASLQPVEEFGLDGDRYWIACADRKARPLSEWLLHRGRMPPSAVRELAIQMAEALAVCHQAKIPHGDLGPRQVLIDARGHVVLPMPGVRPIVRPGEGFASASLAPETYDYLAPERIAEGTQANPASDMYACGALWWHLLTGRPPIAGASGLAKLRATLTARIPPLGPIAPDADLPLVQAIEQCLSYAPGRRPQTMAELIELLGAPSARGRASLAPCALFPGRNRLLKASKTSRARRLASRTGVFAAAASLLIAVAAWPYWGNAWLNARKAAWHNRQDAWVAHAAASPAATERRHANAQPATLAASPPAAPPAPVTVDSQLKPAAYTAAAASESEVLEISDHVRAADLHVRSGQTVRPRSGRATVEVGAEGWILAAEGLTLEDIDFVQPTNTLADALLTCQVARIRFVNCSWQLPVADGRRAAIQWSPPSASTGQLDPAELTLDDCLFRDVAAAVHVMSAGMLAIDINNTLHLGPGPLVKLAVAPAAGEQLVLAATHLTLRDCQGLVECPVRATPGDFGSLTIRAESCALAPHRSGGLVMFTGDDDPAELLAAMRWIGQGSVVAQDAPLAVWRRSDGRRQAAAEDAVQVAGLVRSSLGFAGQRQQDAEASRVVRWQVPLQSADPPGILEARMPGR